MKERFEGTEGRARLLEALRGQHALCSSDEVVEQVASIAEVVEFAAGETLIEEGYADAEVFFLLAGGPVEIYVKDQWVATRHAGEQVGEMAAIDPTAPRSATARAVETVTVAKVSDSGYMTLLRAHHERLWPAIAKILASRLRDRSQFIRPRSARPSVFIGSASEGLHVAERLKSMISAASAGQVEVELWNEGIFIPSATNIESLEQCLDRFDFGVFLFTPDDRVISRRITYDAPRDNVVLEFGLFAGALGRNRVFCVTPRASSTRAWLPQWLSKPRQLAIKRPSDLLGVSVLEYSPAKGDALEQALAPVVSGLVERFTMGPR